MSFFLLTPDERKLETLESVLSSRLFVRINSWFCRVLLWILGTTRKKKDTSSQAAVVSDRASVPLSELQQRALLCCAIAIPPLLLLAYM